MNQLGVSIVICCHNGAFRLAETVKHIAQQKVGPHVPWEFILVDNRCSDHSVAVAESVWAAYHPDADFRVVMEPALGLARARLAGFRAAQYEFMILCDDDNWLAPDYVSTTYSIMSERGSIGALGGYGELYFETDPPKWIAHSRIFAGGEQQAHSGKVARNRIYGAGCVIRKSAFQKLKQAGFRSLLDDRTGSALTSGGDHELCYALAILGYDIWYDQRLRFVHFITRERLTWDYFLRYARESCSCFDVLTSYKMIAANMKAHQFSFAVIARDFFYCIRRFTGILIQRLFTRPDSPSGRVLHFRYIIFREKLIAYIRKHEAIRRNHAEIAKFRENCVRLQQVDSGQSAFTPPSLKPAFFLRPFRPLQ